MAPVPNGEIYQQYQQTGLLSQKAMSFINYSYIAYTTYAEEGKFAAGRCGFRKRTLAAEAEIIRDFLDDGMQAMRPKLEFIVQVDTCDGHTHPFGPP